MSTTHVSLEKYLTDRAETLETYRAMSSADQREWRMEYNDYIVSSGKIIIPPHIYLIIHLQFNKLTPLLLSYIYFLTAAARTDPAPGM